MTSLTSALLPLPALCALAMLAGFVDAVGGGGGLVQVPALLVLLPHQPIAALLGSNKLAGICGTGGAAIRYARSVAIPRRPVLAATPAALIGAYLGAGLVSHLAAGLLKPLVLTMLVGVLIYTLWRRKLGLIHAPRLSARGDVLAGILAGFGLGFYDGFLGPGTGSFLMLTFVAVFGFNFLIASASAKVVNVATNLAALSYFVIHDDVLYRFALPMAASNFVGGWIGSHLAIRSGSGFVRAIFILVVAALILRLGYDVLQPRLS